LAVFVLFVATSFACDTATLMSCLTGVSQCIAQKVAADKNDFAGLCGCLGSCLGDCTDGELSQVFPNFDWGNAMTICQNTASCITNIGQCSKTFLSCHDSAGDDLFGNCQCWTDGAQCLVDAGNCNLPLNTGIQVDCSDYHDIGRAVWAEAGPKVQEFWQQHKDEILATVAADWDPSTHTLSITLSDLNGVGKDIVQQYCDQWASDVNSIIAGKCNGRPICQGLGVVCNIDATAKRATDYTGSLAWSQQANSSSGVFASLTLLLATVWVFVSL